MDSDTMEQSADIIWKYSDMKKEFIEKKVNPSVSAVDELLDSIVPGESNPTTKSEDVEDIEDDEGPKVVKSHTVFISRDKDLDEGYVDYANHSGDHTEIPDDWEYVASLGESEDEGIDADLTGLGEDQVL